MAAPPLAPGAAPRGRRRMQCRYPVRRRAGRPGARRPHRAAALGAVAGPYRCGGEQRPARGRRKDRRARPPLVRVELPIETSPAEIHPYVEAYAAQGAQVLLLAGFSGRIPIEEEVRNLGRWAFGPASGLPSPVQAIEFGNETSYTYQYGDSPQDESYAERARNYARLAAVASDVIGAADPDVGLLVQADDANIGPVWIDAMLGFK